VSYALGVRRVVTETSCDLGPAILIPNTPFSFYPVWVAGTLLQFSSASWSSGSLVTVDKDCTVDAFTGTCFDETNMAHTTHGLVFTLLTPDLLPAEGATLDVFRSFSPSYPYDGEGIKITITVGRNTWCNSDGTGDCATDDTTDGTTNDAIVKTPWYKKKLAVKGASAFMSFATVLLLLLIY